MIASSIGKIFLKVYNRRTNHNYSAKEFFEKEFYPLFYDHPKYMQWITNSPFVQGIRKGSYPTKEEREEKLEKLNEKLSNNQADASIAIGYPSLDELATTSGQLTDLDLPLDENDYYASWIGGGLGIGVKGGFSIYFDEDEILWKIYEGWKKYRSLLDEYEKLRPNQVESWNGQWLAHVYDDDFELGALFNPMSPVTSGKYKGFYEIPTQKWTEILLGIASSPKGESINGYVFSLGQTNTTIGFIPFHLPQLHKPIQFYIDIFGKKEYLDNANRIKSLYGTAFGFMRACQMGVIGVRALEPKDLKSFMVEKKGKIKSPDFKKADEEQQISFNTYQTWLLAMLDNKQLWNKANEAAEAYLQYEQEAKSLSTKNLRAVEEILNSSSKRKFIEANTAIIEKSGSAAEKINDLVFEVNSMPEDSFRYFQTLIKFRYHFLKTQTNKVEQS